ERLKNDTTRPLLQVENPKERIRTLLLDRGPVYEACADVIIDVSELSFEEILDSILENANEICSRPCLWRKGKMK
ncbi:MAG: hypothetical protein HFI97_12870, partial [Lachnospiraceae bacterium]|nr:hypothetical protein [Lachnospiraceae bacterium]